MDKSPDAFRTISEVADDLDLPQHVLRFWETRFGQIKPLKRGGGRRYYRPDDVILLRGIQHLLYREGYTIKGVQRILKEQGLRYVMTVWREDVPQASSAGSADAEAYAPRRGAAREEPEFGDEEEAGPEAYAPRSVSPARAADITARRPNFAPIVDRDAVEDEEVEEEGAEEGDELDGEEGEVAEDEEGDEENHEEEDQDEVQEDEGDADEEAEPAGLSDDQRAQLEAALDELLEARRILGAGD